MTNRARKPLRWWGKLLCVFASLGLFFGVLEIALRLIGVSIPTATVLGTFFQHDPQTGWMGRPNAQAHFQTSNFSVDVGHDADGLRNCGLQTRIADDRASDDRVCWMLGDSTTWGWGISDQDHYVALLNRAAPPDLRFRNLGVPGFSTVQEYFRLKDLFARGYRPDVVLLCFNANDHWDNLLLTDDDPPRPHLRVDERGLQVVEPPVSRSFEFEVGSFLRRNSLAVSYVSYHAQRARHARRSWLTPDRPAPQQGGTTDPATSPPAPTPTSATAKTPPPQPATLPPETRDGLLLILRRLQELCRSADVELAIASEFEMDARLDSVCRELDIRLLDATKRYRRFLNSSEGGQVIFHSKDPHPNAIGHRLFAEAMLEELDDWHPEWRVRPRQVELARDPHAAPTAR